jgi:quercetin dioxygenase-like cupin family protein
MGKELEGGCRAFELSEGEPLRRGTLLLRRHVGRESGAAAISFAAMEFSAGLSPAWRTGPPGEVLFVVSGGGFLRQDGSRRPIAPDTGICLPPGARVAVESAGASPLLVTSARCPDPGPGYDWEDPQTLSSRESPPASIVRFEERPTERAGDERWFRVLVDAAAGSKDATQFVGFIPPGRAPDHFHEYEEVVWILEGQGRFWTGASSAAVEPGSAIFLPRGRPHALENTGERPLKLGGVFYPSGSPAVRFPARR